MSRSWWSSPTAAFLLLVCVLVGAWKARTWLDPELNDLPVATTTDAELSRGQYQRWVESGPDSFPEIEAALFGNDGPSRRVALQAISWIRSIPREMRARVGQLLRSTDPSDRREALFAWTAIQETPPQSIPELARGVTDSDPIVKGTALELLIEIGPETVPAFIELASRSEPGIKYDALTALLTLDATGEVIAEQAHLELNREGQTEEIRRVALAILVCQNGATLDELSKGLRDADPLLRSLALWGTRELGPRAAPLIDDLLRLDPGERIKTPLRPTMGGAILEFTPRKEHHSSPLTVRDLVRRPATYRMRDEMDGSGFTLLSVCGATGPSSAAAIPRFESQLRSENSREVVEAARHLAALGHSREAIESELFEVAKARGIESLPLRLLAEWNSPRLPGVVDELRRRLAASDRSMMLRACESLCQLGPLGIGALPQLETLLQSEEPEGALRTLAAMGAALPVIPPRVLKLADSSADETAILALEVICETGPVACVASSSLLRNLAGNGRAGSVPGGRRGHRPFVTPVNATATDLDSENPPPPLSMFHRPAAIRRERACEALRFCAKDNPAVVEALTTILADPREESVLRALAFEGLFSSGDATRRWQLAQEMLNSGDELVIRLAIVAHQQCNAGPQVEAALCALLDRSRREQLIDRTTYEPLHLEYRSFPTDPQIRLRLVVLRTLAEVGRDESTLQALGRFREQLDRLTDGQLPSANTPKPLNELLGLRRDQRLAIDQAVARIAARRDANLRGN